MSISLFQRILRDEDFQAGKLDTGFLDRMLAKPADHAGLAVEDARVAAIAAGMFAALDPASVATNGTGSAAAGVSSNWKQKGRAEALH